MRKIKIIMRKRMEKRKNNIRKNKDLEFKANKGRNHQGYLQNPLRKSNNCSYCPKHTYQVKKEKEKTNPTIIKDKKEHKN